MSQLKSLKEKAYTLLIESINNGTISQRNSLSLINKINYSRESNVKHILTELYRSAYLGKKFYFKNVKKRSKNETEERAFFEKEAQQLERMVSIEFELWFKKREGVNNKKI